MAAVLLLLPGSGVLEGRLAIVGIALQATAATANVQEDAAAEEQQPEEHADDDDGDEGTRGEASLAGRGWLVGVDDANGAAVKEGAVEGEVALGPGTLLAAGLQRDKEVGHVAVLSVSLHAVEALAKSAAKARTASVAAVVEGVGAGIVGEIPPDGYIEGTAGLARHARVRTNAVAVGVPKHAVCIGILEVIYEPGLVILGALRVGAVLEAIHAALKLLPLLAGIVPVGANDLGVANLGNARRVGRSRRGVEAEGRAGRVWRHLQGCGDGRHDGQEHEGAAACRAWHLEECHEALGFPQLKPR